MRYLLAFAIALILAAVCAVALRAQGVTKTALPCSGYDFNVTVTGLSDGVLMHGTADTMYAPWPPPNFENQNGITVPFVLEATSAGMGKVLLIPDTGRSESHIFFGSGFDMKTAAVHLAPGRIMVAWSKQQTGWDDIGEQIVRQSELNIGMFENGVFRLLQRIDGAADPVLIRDNAGVTHLFWVQQTLRDSLPDSSQYTEYSGEIFCREYRDDVPLAAAFKLMNGVQPMATLDPAGRMHLIAMEYDSVPSPVQRIRYSASDGAAWSAPRVLVDLGVSARRPNAPSALRLKRPLVFSADKNGIARIIVTTYPLLGGIALLMYASDGSSAAIDSTGGRRIRTSNFAIDADGRVICAIDAYKTRANSDLDTLYLCTLEPGQSSAGFERLYADSVTYRALHLLPTKRDGLCLTFAKGNDVNLYGRLDRGSRLPQFVTDYFAASLSGNATACDSTGAMWFAYTQAKAGIGTAWLLRVADGTVAVPRLATPAALDLACFPNPATKDATLRFSLPSSQSVTITVHDMLGREVLRAADGVRYEQGTQLLPMRLDALRPGAYLCHLEAESGAATTAFFVP